ncbi:hypothetical protein LSUE1_G007884 [Lachnellula suecica]|uniref:Uncharacterized protein n=1 Tax=Lachnellula suecica TaxID=602035 RepID=A0A8T9BYF0_9HELO|nr:hypothetical protein LSUE1_G007884 [Lachnellula suecica]
MAPGSKILLPKGPLRAPPSQPTKLSYTQAPASKDEVTIRKGTARKEAVAIEGVPQPFLNPSIIQQRIQTEQQWQIAQDRARTQEAGSGH